jgi:pyruvate/2-oxoglutarate dehydrogenase complex dihydrolipoamide acyltransferase (E2) component
MRYTGFYRAVRHIHRDIRRRWRVSFVNEVDVRALEDLRAAAKRAGLTAPSYTACVTKAIAMSVAEVRTRFPEVNAMIGQFLGWHWIKSFGQIAAGVAVSRDEGGHDAVYVLSVPEPQSKTLVELTQTFAHASTADISELPAYKANKQLYAMPGPIQRLMLYLGLNNADLHAKHRGTFGLTTVGKFGIDIQSTMPQTNPIQWGFGKVKPRPFVRDGAVVAAPTMFLTLSFDRKLLNGRPCAELMERTSHILSTGADGEWVKEYAGKQEADNAARVA